MYSGDGSCGAGALARDLFSSYSVSRVENDPCGKLRGVSSSQAKPARHARTRMEFVPLPTVAGALHFSTLLRILKRSSVSLLLSSIMTALIILCVLCFLLECALDRP